MHPLEAARELSNACDALSFGDPVAYRYNPFAYAWDGHRQYVQRFGDDTKQTLMVGMNPGPWGMAQTGVPFGDPDIVREAMGIEAIDVHAPPEHREARPIYGLGSPRNEVSGTRLYEGLIDAFGDLQTAYEDLFIANYCPLIFFDDEDSNLTPPKLRKHDQEPLFEVCDEHLAHLIAYYEPEHLVGIGRFAERRINATLEATDHDADVHYLLHPSPANPHANKDGGAYWQQQLEILLETCGLSAIAH